MISQLNPKKLDEFLKNEPKEYSTPSYPYSEIRTMRAIKAYGEKLDKRVELKTYEIINCKKVEIAKRAEPKYFLIDLDTETSGDKTADGEVVDLTKYLELIQISIHEPKKITSEVYSDSRKFIVERLSIDETKGSTVLIYFAPIEREWEKKLKDQMQYPLEPLKGIMESHDQILDIMHADFEYRQLPVKFNHEFRSIEDIEVRAKKLFTDTIVSNPASDDVESTYSLAFRRKLADFFKDKFELSLKESDISFNYEFINPKSHNLAAITRIVLGEFLNKESQVSDWSLEVLGQDQKDYARLDTEISFRILLALINSEQKIEDEVLIKLADINNVEDENLSDSEILEKQIKNLISTIRDLYDERYSILESTDKLETLLTYITGEKLTEELISKVILPQVYDKKRNEIVEAGEEVPRDFEVSFDTLYGSVSYRPTEVRNVDFENVSDLGTSILANMKVDCSKRTLIEKFGQKEGSRLWYDYTQREYKDPKLSLSFNKNKALPEFEIPDFEEVYKSLDVGDYMQDPKASIENLLKRSMAMRARITDILVETGMMIEMVFVVEQIRILRQVLEDKQVELYHLKNNEELEDEQELEFKGSLSVNTDIGFSVLKERSSIVKNIEGMLNEKPEVVDALQISLPDKSLNQFLSDRKIRSLTKEKIQSSVNPVEDRAKLNAQVNVYYGKIYK